MENTLAQPEAVVDAIRQAEMEANRRLAAKRELATERLETARRAAAARSDHAEAAGRLEGDNGRQAARLQAEHHAAGSVAAAQTDAETLRRAGEAAMPAAVAMALRFVLDGDHAP